MCFDEVTEFRCNQSLHHVEKSGHAKSGKNKHKSRPITIKGANTEI